MSTMHSKETGNHCCNDYFILKLWGICFSAYGGIVGKDKPGLLDIVDKSYRSDVVQYNPPIELIEHEMLNIVSSLDNTKPLNFSKGRYLQVIVAFADQHNLSLAEFAFPTKKAKQFVHDVLTMSKENNCQVGVIDQFRIALKISEGNVIEAAIIAHTGSRAIAKNFDSRILSFTSDELKDWKDGVASFDGVSEGYGSPPADTYHFWSAFVAGLVSMEIYSSKDYLLNPIYNMLYTHMAEFTDFLRYKIMRNGDGTTHKEADIFGFHLGSLIADFLHDRKDTIS